MIRSVRACVGDPADGGGPAAVHTAPLHGGHVGLRAVRRQFPLDALLPHQHLYILIQVCTPDHR